MSTEGIERSLIDSIGQPVVGVATDLTELALDSLLDDGVLRDLPVLSSIIGLCRTGTRIRDLLFLKKVARFLLALEKVPQNDVADFKERLSADEQHRRRVSEHLLELLDRLDDVEKSDLVARAFEAYLKSRITYADFRQLAFGIDRCFAADLKQIRYLGTHMAAAVGVRLSSAGLVQLAFRTEPIQNQRGSPYIPTSVGRLMVDHVIAWSPPSGR